MTLLEHDDGGVVAEVIGQLFWLQENHDVDLGAWSGRVIEAADREDVELESFSAEWVEGLRGQ